MSKEIYSGINNLARKTPRVYVSPSGKARKLLKGYVGVNEKARLFYTSGPDLPEYTWKISSCGLSQKWTSIAFGNGMFVAIAYGSSSAVRSSDGVNWTSFSLPSSSSSNYWRNIIFANGRFVAIGDSTGATSTDGINWTEAKNVSTLSGGGGLVYNGSEFVARNRNDNGAGPIYKSTDGINWTKQTVTISTNESMNDSDLMQYGDGLYMYYTYTGGGNYYKVYSYDAISWIAEQSNIHGPIAFGDGKFATRYKYSSSSYRVRFSDANRQSISTLNLSMYNAGVIKYADVNGVPMFMILPSDNYYSLCEYTSDGLSSVTADMTLKQEWRDCAYGNGKWVAIAYESSMFAYTS